MVMTSYPLNLAMATESKPANCAVPPAPGKWNTMETGSTGPAPGNMVMMPVMMQVPEQAVLLGCNPSGDASCQGPQPINVWSTTDSMSTMAVLSSDSLPVFQNGGCTFAVQSMDTLPSMKMQQFSVNSMDSLPAFTMPEPSQNCNVNAYAAQSMESLPCMSATKPAARRRKRGGRKGLTHEPTVDEELDNDKPIGKPMNKRVESIPAPHKAPQVTDRKPAEEPTDPVILELEEGSYKTQRHTLEWITSSVWPLAITSRGSRILQKALELGTGSDHVMILNRLRGRVQEAMKSPHANYVLQKCIEVMAPERVQVILDELKGDAVMAARHRFGCRILQRLIEHCPLEQTEELSAEVLSEADALCRHQFGNFVVQHILQHGSAEHKKAIADVLHGDVIRLAKHRIASHVVSCALVHCAPEDVQRLTQVVLEDAGQLADLSRREYGSFVVREVNRVRRMHA